MNFDLDVSYKQQQKLVMTQQMKISINILQMASYDLREYINREYEENPIIEYQYTEEYIQYKNGESIFKEKSNAEQYGQYKQCRKEIKNEKYKRSLIITFQMWQKENQRIYLAR